MSIFISFLVYSSGLFCQQILKGDFVHICMFARDFWAEGPLGVITTVLATFRNAPLLQRPGLQKLSSSPETGLHTFPFLLFHFTGMTLHICKMDQKCVNAGRVDTGKKNQQSRVLLFVGDVPRQSPLLVA